MHYLVWRIPQNIPSYKYILKTSPMTPEHGLDSTLLLPQGPSHKVFIPVLTTGHRNSKGFVWACMCGGLGGSSWREVEGEWGPLESRGPNFCPACWIRPAWLLFCYLSLPYLMAFFNAAPTSTPAPGTLCCNTPFSSSRAHLCKQFPSLWSLELSSGLSMLGCIPPTYSTAKCPSFL